MRAVDIGATVGADGVEIGLPRLRVVVERRQAERLRDALVTVLPPREGRHLLCMWDHVDPELSGPFKDERERTEAAQDFRRAHGDGNSAYRLNASAGGVSIETIGEDELVMPKPARVPVHVGDRVLDPLDGQWREVTKVTGLAVVFADGGTMGIREAQEADKRLPSESQPVVDNGTSCPACEAWVDGGGRILTAQEWIDGRDDLCEACIKAGRGAGMHS